MLEIDGGEGGGQLLRTALALSALTGQEITVTDVRGERPTPGLRPQHLAAVTLLAEIADADVSGAAVGSETVTFEPGPPRAGSYEVDIGTAGAITLLFDAVLPLALGLDGGLSVAARGGTDVAWSPTEAFLRRVKLPLLRWFGVHAALDLDRTGFYPTGGGAATLYLAPSAPEPIELSSRGEPVGIRIDSKASADLADREVAERQAEAVASRLASDELPVTERTVRYAESPSTGSALVVRLDFENAVAGADALGEPGKPSEAVAADAVERVRAVLDGPAGVDPHLADQLVVFLGLCGGRVAIPRVTDHVRTSLDLLAEFGIPVSVSREGESPVLVASGVS